MKKKTEKSPKKETSRKCCHQTQKKIYQKDKKSKDRGPLTMNYLPIMNKKIQARKTWSVKIELDTDKDRYEFTSDGEMMITQVVLGQLIEEMTKLKSSTEDSQDDYKAFEDFSTQKMNVVLEYIKCTNEAEKKKLRKKMVNFNSILKFEFLKFILLKIFFLFII